MGSSSLIVLLISGIAFSAGGIAVAKIFVKGTKNPQKGQAYECGIPSEGTPWNQFNVGYYLFALGVFNLRRGADFFVPLGCCR
jgi:NADH-quinone oxidoreductase subunit A